MDSWFGVRITRRGAAFGVADLESLFHTLQGTSNDASCVSAIRNSNNSKESELQISDILAQWQDYYSMCDWSNYLGMHTVSWRDNPTAEESQEVHFLRFYITGPFPVNESVELQFQDFPTRANATVHPVTCDQSLRYDFDGDTNGLFAVPGFTIRYKSHELPVEHRLSENEIRTKLQGLSCFNGFPKGAVRYEVAIMTQLILIYRKHVQRKHTIEATTPIKLATTILEKLGLTQGNVDGWIVADHNLLVGHNNERLWPLGTLFLESKDGKKVSKEDYKTKEYKELNLNALATKIVSAVGNLNDPKPRLARVIEAFGKLQEPQEQPREQVPGPQQQQDGEARLGKRLRASENQPFTYASNLLRNDQRITQEQLNSWKLKACDAIEDYNDHRQFQRDFLFGDVSMALLRLRKAKPKAREEADLYASKWARALDPMNEDHKELLAANQLDADRKVCLEFLYRLYNCCCAFKGDLPNLERVESIIRAFDRDKRIAGMLHLLLVFDRAKAVHFNEDDETGIRGMHWYGEKDLPGWEHTNASKHTINKRLVWFVVDYLKITSKECEYGWLFELLQPRMRETN